MKRRFIFTLLVFMSLQLTFANNPHGGDGNGGEKKVVKASWYGKEFHGKPTASGEKYDMNALTAAHKTLPFGTKVKITNVRTNKSVIVRINDRGPFVKGRKFDLSKAAFHQIAANKDRGVITVNYEIL